MRRFLLISVLVLAVVLVVLLGLAYGLLNNEAFLKEQLAKYTRESTGRELVIAGPLDLSLGRETTFEASAISLGNAPWADDPNMLEVGHVKATIEIFSLFGDLVYLPYLLLEDCAIEILENDAGESNWDFPGEVDEAVEEEDTEGLLPFALREVVINDCYLLYDEPGRTQALDVRIASATLQRALHDRVVGEVSGSVNGEALDIDGWLGPARAFIAGGELRHELNFRAGDVTLQTSGTIADLTTFSGPDVHGHFRGPDIARFLSNYSLPPVSEGPFDFRAGISTRDGMVLVDVDGDLGTLDMTVDAELDKLASPGEGYMNVSMTGPDLQAFGQALGFGHLVGKSFSWHSEFGFEEGVMRIDRARLETGADRLDFSGTLSTRTKFAGSALALDFASDEIGRWMPLVGRAEEALGAAAVKGDATIDSEGFLSIDARASYEQSELEARGIIGRLGSPPAPDLDFAFRSSNMPRLANLVGYQGFPARPFILSGHARKEGQELHLSNLELALDQSTATASGTVSLARNFAGSKVNADISIPDVADFGLLFGVDDLLHEPLHIVGQATLEDGGLAFHIGDSSLGEIRLKLDGRIADLEQPLGVDANFDLYLPGLRFLKIWLPDLELPRGPFKAQGRLVNQTGRTRVENMQVQLASVEADIDGNVDHDGPFDVLVRANGPDLSVLNDRLGIELRDVPFEFSSRIAGNPAAFTLEELDLTSGQSRIMGTLNLELGEVKRISGDLVSPYLNLNPWTDDGDEAAEAPPAEASKYLFDETPVAQVIDIGLELDIRLEADQLDVSGAQYDRLDIGVLMTKDRLEIRPFGITGVRGGNITGELVLDSEVNPPRLDATLHATDMKLLAGASEGQDPATLPTSNVDMELRGAGLTRREMASSLDGRVRFSVGPGKLAPAAYSLIVSDFITELFRALNPYSEKQEFTELECAVLAADIVSGQVTLEPVVFHTRQLTIISGGKINLDDERLDVTFNTKQRKGLGLSASDLVNPFIKVGGTLAKPSLQLDPAGTVVKGGIAVATGGLSILASSLVDRYFSSKDPCGDALKEIEKRDGELP